MSKPRKPIAGLDEAIESHAQAFARGEREAAERLVARRGLETHGSALAAAAEAGLFSSFKVLARARIGFQYIAKVRWSGARGKFISQNRWSQESGEWKIVEVENLSGRRSAWSQNAAPARGPRSENSHA